MRCGVPSLPAIEATLTMPHDAGVVHQDVDAPERLDRVTHELIGIGRAADIAAQPDRAVTGVRQPMGRLLGDIDPDVCDGKPGSGPRKPLRDRGSDPPGSAGDQRHSAGQRAVS